MTIAENAGNIGLPANGLHQIGRKGVALRREISPVERYRRAGDLPMAGRRILAFGDFTGGTVKTENTLRRFHARGNVAACLFRDLQQAERTHVRQFQRTGAKPGFVRSARGTEFSDMAKRVRAKIAIVFRIGCTADTEGIQNEKKCSCHNSPKQNAPTGNVRPSCRYRSAKREEGSAFMNHPVKPAVQSSPRFGLGALRLRRTYQPAATTMAARIYHVTA
ncbi:hypothetical protein D3C86_1412670 [compost metagenome]